MGFTGGIALGDLLFGGAAEAAGTAAVSDAAFGALGFGADLAVPAAALSPEALAGAAALDSSGFGGGGLFSGLAV